MKQNIFPSNSLIKDFCFENYPQEIICSLDKQFVAFNFPKSDGSTKIVVLNNQGLTLQLLYQLKQLKYSIGDLHLICFDKQNTKILSYSTAQNKIFATQLKAQSFSNSTQFLEANLEIYFCSEVITQSFINVEPSPDNNLLLILMFNRYLLLDVNLVSLVATQFFDQFFVEQIYFYSNHIIQVQKYGNEQYVSLKSLKTQKYFFKKKGDLTFSSPFKLNGCGSILWQHYNQKYGYLQNLIGLKIIRKIKIERPSSYNVVDFIGLFGQHALIQMRQFGNQKSFYHKRIDIISLNVEDCLDEERWFHCGQNLLKIKNNKGKLSGYIEYDFKLKYIV